MVGRSGVALSRSNQKAGDWGMTMRTLILAVAIFMLAGSADAFARGGSHGHSHGHARHGHSGVRPASPSVPPSLTSDPRLTGDAPSPSHRQPRRRSAPVVSEKRDPQDIALDRKIKSICRGC
jgi:hypothetical protein